MNDTLFSQSFNFFTFEFVKFHCTDNRRGVPTHYFVYMLKGSCKIVTDSETISAKTGDIVYIPDKCRYQSYWYGSPEIKFISLGFPYLPNFENKSFPVQVIQKSEKAAELFFVLGSKSRLNAEDIGNFYILAGILLPLMKYDIPCRTKQITEFAKEYLIKNPFAKPIEIAKHCAVSQSALYSAFKKSSDITLNELRNNIRLEMAKDILVTTDKTIGYISDILMFSSVSYFRKKFKQYFNITPSYMRKQNGI